MKQNITLHLSNQLKMKRKWHTATETIRLFYSNLMLLRFAVPQIKEIEKRSLFSIQPIRYKNTQWIVWFVEIEIMNILNRRNATLAMQTTKQFWCQIDGRNLCSLIDFRLCILLCSSIKTTILIASKTPEEFSKSWFF